ncbi:sensor domain-containing protein [Rhizobium sp. LjRoot254]|uniref:sensor domain-containing protein n=1 Tax=Rhizobium sp. LjRoot254 TaxID=3342297 RepID=UPI003ED13B15
MKPHQEKISPAGIPGGRASLAELIDSAPGGLALIAADCDILYCNQACAAFLRGSSSLAELVHPDDRHTLEFSINRLRLAPQNAQAIEIRLLRADGSDVWMLAQLSTARLTVHGDAAEILVQLTDIDRQKRTEAEMQSWAQRWNHALVGSILGVWDHNYATGQFYYSETWKTMRGFAPDAIIDADMETWIESVHPDDREMVLEEIRKQGEGGDFKQIFEYRERHSAGHYIWIECRGACIDWFEDGKPARIVGTDTDVSARKATEEALRQLSRKLDLALEVSRIGVFEVDVEKGTSLWDERLQEIYGTKGQPLLQNADDWQEMIHPDDRERAIAKVEANAGKGGTAFENAFRIIRGDGSIRHIRARVAPFNLDSGDTRIIGANWDATQDVTIQQELAEANRLAEARYRELETTKAAIEHNALHDFLTALPNRRYLDEVLSQRAADSLANGSGIAIIHLDLDRFKQINDTLGHLAGDHMLIHTAKVLNENMGPGDFVARIGGDEFVILSRYDGSEDKLGKLASRIIKRLCDPVSFENHVCRIGASIGIAYAGGRAIDAKQLLLNADIALYRAKTQGRNRFEFFSVAIQNDVINTKRVSDDILSGLERGEFVPYYQLQFHAQSLDISGAETLARWNHPTNGLLTPDSFLQVAEDLDVVSAIDGIILESALKDYAAWQTLGISIPKISVNVSSRRLNDPALSRKLKSLKIVPGTVSFELLESIFLDDCDEAVNDNLQAIRKLGIGIEIDDFGTGHASIVSLLKIGPGTLKIDRALIKPIAETTEQRKLVGSIIEIGKSLGIKVVAEGVETREHIRILQDLGCDLLQGYALARPLDFEAVTKLARQQSWRT